MAAVCLVLTGATIAENSAKLAACREHVDSVELRVDLLDRGEWPHITRFPGMCGLPAICTVRRARDGGGYEGPESDRAELYRGAATAGFAYLDLESDFRPELPLPPEGTRATEVIRSFHEFDCVPDDLDRLYRTLSANPAEIPKLAVAPKRFTDAARLCAASKAWGGGRRIVLGMGSYGFFTRVLAAKIGSMLTFTSAPGEAAAPGHIDPATLCGLYRFRSITAATRVFGVIGDPVMHSRSPSIHNPAFAAIGLDAVYLPFHVDDPDAIFDACDLLDLDGFSVTVPHKERVIPRLASRDEHVTAIGSCNTVLRDRRRGDVFSGLNTDVPGFIAALKRFLAPGPIPKRALVIGAGGTAISVLYALRSLGTEVLVVNRTADRAASLARRWGATWATLSAESVPEMQRYAELIVQTTSAGMHPNDDLDPIDFFPLSGSEALFDVVYAPPKTKLLARAEAAGCRTENGFGMLLEQAYVQFEAFTGKAYPVEAAPAAPTA